MNTLPTSTPPLPLRGWLLALLCAVFLIVGLLGHDPWKGEDVIHIGVAWSFAASGDWFNPRIAGEAWQGSPPFYHWLAAALGKLLGGWLGFHNAARLASLLCAGILLLTLRKSAKALRQLQQNGETEIEGIDLAAILLAVSTLGLLVPLHEAQPAVALLAASSLAYWGLARMAEKTWGGALAGAGIGLAYLSGGMLGLLTLLPVALLLVPHPHWHTRSSLIGGGLGLVMLGVLVFLWPAGWQTNVPEIRAPGRDHFELLAWFAWPVLPLALWGLWLSRRRLLQASVYLPLAGMLVTLIEFLLFFEPRALPSLPLLIPQILLAATAAHRLRRGAANAFDWFGMMTLTIAAALVWLGAIAMMFGVPVRLAHNFARLEPGFVAEWNTLAWGFAALVTLFWLWLLLRLPRTPWRALIRWAAGVGCVWLLVATLWMPWVDYGKTYRQLAQSLVKALPADHGCIAGQGLSEAHRASLDYLAGIRPLSGADALKQCRWLLMQQNAHDPVTVDQRWHQVWEGNRPGDRHERFRLYKKSSP